MGQRDRAADVRVVLHRVGEEPADLGARDGHPAPVARHGGEGRTRQVGVDEVDGLHLDPVESARVDDACLRLRVGDLRCEEQREDDTRRHGQQRAGRAHAVRRLDDEPAHPVTGHRGDHGGGAPRPDVRGRPRRAAQPHADRVLADAERDDDRVVTGDQGVDGRGVGRVTVDPAHAGTGEGGRVAGQGGDGVAAGGELGDGRAARPSGGSDDEHVHGDLQVPGGRCDLRCAPANHRGSGRSMLMRRRNMTDRPAIPGAP